MREEAWPPGANQATNTVLALGSLGDTWTFLKSSGASLRATRRGARARGHRGPEAGQWVLLETTPGPTALPLLPARSPSLPARLSSLETQLKCPPLKNPRPCPPRAGLPSWGPALPFAPLAAARIKTCLRAPAAASPGPA